MCNIDALDDEDALEVSEGVLKKAVVGEINDAAIK